MPLPLTISCFSKIQIGFTFLVPAHPGSPGKRAVKWVRMCLFVRHIFFLTPNQQYQSTDGMNVLITLMLTSVQSNLTIDIVVLLSVTKSKSLLIDGIPWAHTSLPFPPPKKKWVFDRLSDFVQHTDHAFRDICTNRPHLAHHAGGGTQQLMDSLIYSLTPVETADIIAP